MNSRRTDPPYAGRGWLAAPHRPDTVIGAQRAWHGAAAVAATVALLLLAGCGSSAAPSASVTTSPHATLPAGVQYAEKAVASYTALPHYALPTAAVKNVSALRGKKVYYVPITSQAPIFSITASGLREALAAIGASLTVCDGGANPSQTSACVNQAISAHAGAIVFDAVPYAFAENALNQARAHHIAILIGQELPPPGAQQNDAVSYIIGNGDEVKAVSDWIIADSKGRANVVVAEEADTPTTVALIDQYLTPEFSKHCPKCKVTIVKVTASTPSLQTSQVSAALLRDPGAQYLYAEFEDALQPVQAAAQQANLSSIKGVTATATLGGLQQLRSGNFLYLDAAIDDVYNGWAYGDRIIRMMLGRPIVAENTPKRLITRANVRALTLTNPGQVSGQWFGAPDYRAQFKKLWGVR